MRILFAFWCLMVRNSQHIKTQKLLSEPLTLTKGPESLSYSSTFPVPYSTVSTDRIPLKLMHSHGKRKYLGSCSQHSWCEGSDCHMLSETFSGAIGYLRWVKANKKLGSLTGNLLHDSLYPTVIWKGIIKNGLRCHRQHNIHMWPGQTLFIDYF